VTITLTEISKKKFIILKNSGDRNIINKLNLIINQNGITNTDFSRPLRVTVQCWIAIINILIYVCFSCV